MRPLFPLLIALAAPAPALAGPFRTATPTLTVSALPTASPTPSITLTHTISPTWSVSPTWSASPTITLTPTPGEGSYTMNPPLFVMGQPGSEFDLSFVAGPTAFPMSGGLVTIFFPVEFGDPAQHFSVHPLDRPRVGTVSVSGQRVSVEVRGLAAGGSLVFRYGHSADGFILNAGVPGTVTPTFSPTLTPTPTLSPTFTDVPGGSSATATPSISATATLTPSSTVSPTISPTWTPMLNLLVWAYPQSLTLGAGGLLLVQPTFVIVSATVTPTPTITQTSTITQTWTSSPTSTATPTITQTWTETPIGALQADKVYAYPNPFDLRRFYKVTFRFPPDTDVLITVFNLAGEPVRELPARDIQASQGWAIWPGLDDYGRRVTGGLYYVRVRGTARVLTRKFTVLN